MTARPLKTFQEVAEEWGLFECLEDPVRWLTAQHRRGRITARKIGRTWYMDKADMAAAWEVFAARKPVREVVESVPRIGLSAASQRRRAS